MFDIDTKENNLIKYAKKVQKGFGKSFYLGTLFFPKRIREAVYIYYTFVRIPDEFVDTETNKTKAKRQIEEFEQNWYKISHNQNAVGGNHLEIITSCYKLFRKYNVPLEYNDIFLQAMLSDLTVKRYAKYLDLEKYMFGSAGVVGLTMTHFIGYEKKIEQKEQIFYCAEKLAEAFQMTNFLRDIDEDYSLRDRIYLPEEDLIKFEVNELNFKNKVCNESFKNLMEFQIKRTERLYEEALPGISLLNFHGRFAILFATNLYRAILNKIINQNYNIFNKRVHTNILDKMLILIKTIIQFIWIHLRKKS